MESVKFSKNHIVCCILLAFAAVLIGNAVNTEIINNELSSNPIISGIITNVISNHDRFNTLKATVEFPDIGNINNTCKINANFNLGSQKIKVGNPIRVYVPKAQCGIPYFPDYLTPAWLSLAVAAIVMCVVAILFCRRF